MTEVLLVSGDSGGVVDRGGCGDGGVGGGGCCWRVVTVGCCW